MALEIIEEEILVPTKVSKVTVTLRLNSDEVASLVREANGSGVEVEDLIASVLRGHISSSAPSYARRRSSKPAASADYKPSAAAKAAMVEQGIREAGQKGRYTPEQLAFAKNFDGVA